MDGVAVAGGWQQKITSKQCGVWRVWHILRPIELNQSIYSGPILVISRETFKLFVTSQGPFYFNRIKF
jgi:hypothetical protein